MALLLSINKTFEKYIKENPGSQLTGFAIRTSVKNGSLPSVKINSKNLINSDVFASWIKGELNRG